MIVYTVFIGQIIIIIWPRKWQPDSADQSIRPISISGPSKRELCFYFSLKTQWKLYLILQQAWPHLWPVNIYHWPPFQQKDILVNICFDSAYRAMHVIFTWIHLNCCQEDHPHIRLYECPSLSKDKSLPTKQNKQSYFDKMCYHRYSL